MSEQQRRRGHSRLRGRPLDEDGAIEFNIERTAAAVSACPQCGSTDRSRALRVPLSPTDHPHITQQTSAVCGDPWHSPGAIATPISERDERISEPPALEGELDRWYDLATDRVVAVLGTGEMRSFIPGNGWIGSAGTIAKSTAIERLAAELAACRARDEGDELPLLQRAVGLAGMVALTVRDGDRDELHLLRLEAGSIQRAYTALLARRATASAATATTATPTKEQR